MNTQYVKPYHTFNHKGIWYLVNIEDMTAFVIDEATVNILNELPKSSDLFKKIAIKLSLISDVKYPEIDLELNEQSSENDNIPITSIALFLTQSCNLNCVYCYGDGGGYGSSGSMKDDVAFHSIDWLIENSLDNKKIHIGFFGGEPFINFPLMEKIVAYATEKAAKKNKDVYFNATTNATLLDDEKITFIKKHNISITVSIDGFRNIQNSQRPFKNGTGSYDTVVHNCKELLKIIPNTSAHAVLLRDADPQKVKDAILDIGFASVSTTIASASLFGDKEQEKLANRDTNFVVRELIEEADMWNYYLQVEDMYSLQKLKQKSQLYPAIRALLHNTKRLFSCGAGLSVVAISVAGDVYLCQRFVGMEQYKLGSVFDKKLNRDAYIKPMININPCDSCFAKYYCAGGCKHDNVGYCDSVFTPTEDKCRLRQHEFELAVTIVSSLDDKKISLLSEHNIFEPKPCPFDF